MMPAKGEAAELQTAYWSAPEVAFRIEYSPEIMDEVRAYACDTLSRLSHGGREVGGVMYGLQRAGVIRVVTWRPIKSEYANGDILKLSNNDRLTLAVQFEAARGNAELKDLRPVGWFVTHYNGTVAMTEADLETYSGFFPESSQVTLVIHPTGGGRAEAGFFVRETDGSVKSDASYKQFVLEPMIAAPAVTTIAPPEPVPVPVAPPPEPNPPAAPLAPLAAEVPVALALPSFTIDEPLPARERWLWAIPIALALGIAGWLLYVSLVKPRAQKPVGSVPMGFHVASSVGRTAQLEWDANAGAVRDGQRGELDVNDGGKSSQIALSSDQLHAGKMTYLAQSGDVGFDLAVYASSGAALHESTRLVAPAVSEPPPHALASATGDDTQLQAQVRRLTEDLRKERARADQLQNLVRILENRLGVHPGESKAPQ
jgi:JAB1/Mov34/MPN/PAD-1 ubiquitin protease